MKWSEIRIWLPSRLFNYGLVISCSINIIRFLLAPLATPLTFQAAYLIIFCSFFFAKNKKKQDAKNNAQLLDQMDKDDLEYFEETIRRGRNKFVKA